MFISCIKDHTLLGKLDSEANWRRKTAAIEFPSFLSFFHSIFLLFFWLPIDLSLFPFYILPVTFNQRQFASPQEIGLTLVDAVPSIQSFSTHSGFHGLSCLAFLRLLNNKYLAIRTPPRNHIPSETKSQTRRRSMRNPSTWFGT